MTTGPARALLRRLGQFLDGFSACFSRQPQREAATQCLVVPVRAGMLAIDDTGFPKQGTRSVGVQRQYCGALGKIGNCPVAVSSASIADGRTWPLAFGLYIPVSWIDDAPRRVAAGIPATLPFREKWRIALAQGRAILQAGFTITGVVGDADYGATRSSAPAWNGCGLDHVEGRTIKVGRTTSCSRRSRSPSYRLNADAALSSPAPPYRSSADGYARSWACSTSSTIGGSAPCSTASRNAPLRR